MAPGTHWSELSFKNVNLKSMGAPVGGGNFHPLLKVENEKLSILNVTAYCQIYSTDLHWTILPPNTGESRVPTHSDGNGF